MPNHRTEFSAPFLVLCEGQGDQGFYERLLSLHRLADKFNVSVPINTGKDGFGEYLGASSGAPTFREFVKAILVIADNDDDPVKAFADVQKQLKDTDHFPVPDADKTVSRRQGVQSIVVLMLPFGRPGNLETLCVEAAEEKWQLTAHIENYLAQTEAKDWGLSKQSKMKMQCVLAATCKKQPDITLAGHWKQKDKYHVPITSKRFDDVVAFLKGFEALVK